MKNNEKKEFIIKSNFIKIILLLILSIKILITTNKIKILKILNL